MADSPTDSPTSSPSPSPPSPIQEGTFSPLPPLSSPRVVPVENVLLTPTEERKAKFEKGMDSQNNKEKSLPTVQSPLTPLDDDVVHHSLYQHQGAHIDHKERERERREEGTDIKVSVRGADLLSPS